jgi:CBS domain-containing protein
VHFLEDDTMKARDIMTANPAVVTPDAPIAQAAGIMRDLDVGIVPVVDDTSSMHLEGVITDRDIAVRCVAQRHAPTCHVSDHMTARNIDTVTPDADIGEVIAMMEQERVRRIPVVDEARRLVGIIAQADLALKLGPIEPLEVEKVLERVSEPVPALREAAR